LTELKRTNLSVQAERAVLVKVFTPEDREHGVGDPFAELAALAKAAGAMVLDGLTQKLRHISARTYIGKGKVQELVERVEANDANLVIFDNDLAPAQIRELEKHVNCKILDRSELILDIFAARARTHESRLQVELAQLQYTAPRLRGMWTHLERIAGAGGGSGAGAVGGIGTRGPGERQIEIDRRIVKDRVSALRRELAEIDGRKLRQVESRSNCFTVSLVGYTNSGKSTLLNRLTGSETYVADKLFATLDTKTVRWDLDDTCDVLLSDTVGFVRNLPHRLVASFRATLEEAVHADLLLHVIDASNPEAADQARAVAEVLGELGCADRPTLHVLNKMDAVATHADLALLESRMSRTCRISAATGEGIDRLREMVRDVARENTLSVTLRLAPGDGRTAAEIDRQASVSDRRYSADALEMDVVVDRRLLEKLTGQHPTIEVLPRSGSAAVVEAEGD
jgi:GTP-binding protein HflX